MPIESLPPFPVVLDLSDLWAYSALTTALTEYASGARFAASAEDQSERPDTRLADDLRKLAEAAERLLIEVDRQLEASEKTQS